MKDTLKIILTLVIAAAVVIAPAVTVIWFALILLLWELVGRWAAPPQYRDMAGHRKRNQTRARPRRTVVVTIGVRGQEKRNQTQDAQGNRQTGRSRENGAEVAAQPSRNRTWREVLGFKEGEKPTMMQVNSAWRRLAKSAHPDVGGTDSQMAELNAALDEAGRVLQHKRPS